MRFSVIIPNLNSPVIDQTLSALEKQCRPGQDEILVIGLDEPGLVRESSLVRWIATDRPVSPAAARNIGLRYARGEVICFIDADCVPASDWLDRIEQRFRSPAVHVLGGGVDTSQRDFWALCVHLSAFHDYLVCTPAGTREQLPTLNLAIRKKVLDEVGYFDERFVRSEDADLTTRLRLRGYPLHFDPAIVVDHRPERHTWRAACEHAIQSGFYSIKVHPLWREKLRSPLVLRHWWLLLLTAPLLALGVTLNIYRNRRVWRWWYLAPAVFCLKIAWCWGAAQGMRQWRDV